MRLLHPLTVRFYWGAMLAIVGGAFALAVFYAPIDTEMGPAQKIVYLHMPVAVNTFLATLVVFIASIGYIGSRRRAWDALAYAAGEVAVLCCTVVVVTGAIWARDAWGQWWVWSPRLTFSLILWLLYVAYALLRPTIRPAHRRALVMSIYGAVAFLDVPLVYLSVKLLPDIHPSSVPLGPEMRITMAVWLAAITMLCAGLVVARYSLAKNAIDRTSVLDADPPFHIRGMESHA